MVLKLQMDAAALRRIPTIERKLVLLQKMLIEAIGFDIVPPSWALVDSDWPHKTQSAQGRNNRHCARPDVGGRCLAAAAITGSDNRGTSSNKNAMVGGTRVLHTIYHECFSFAF